MALCVFPRPGGANSTANAAAVGMSAPIPTPTRNRASPKTERLGATAVTAIQAENHAVDTMTSQRRPTKSPIA